MAGVDPKHRSNGSRRMLILPAILLLLLAGMPWVLEMIEERWLGSRFTRFGETVDSIITLLLGLWILVMIRREQITSHRHLEELEHLSLTDPLSGLGNRRAFERDLENALRRAQRTSEPVALVYLDVDGLKRLNDRYGHVTGDETLRALGAVLRSCSRSGTDSAYRVGGDEFVMVLAADRGGAEAIAERVMRAFHDRSPRHSRASTGVVVWDGESRAQHLIDEADTRMYRHKHPEAGFQTASG
jgi:diguanylate cyclase (GGDEF)-like protein